MRKFQDKPLHPFLFGLFPVLSLYFHNISEVTLPAVFKPLILALLGVGFLLILAKLVFRTWRKAAVFVSPLVLVLLSHGHAHTWFANVVGGEHWFEVFGFTLGIDEILFLTWTVLFMALFFFLYRLERGLLSTTKFLNLVAVILFVIPLSGSVFYEVSNLSTRVSQKGPSGKESIKVGEDVERPDIYYIVLDRYASNETLKEFYGYDNSSFTNFLAEKGFYVAEDSQSNYPRTILSLAASLNMEYVNYLTDEAGEDSDDQTLIYPLVDAHKVGNTLNSLGYKYLHTGSWFEPTKSSSIADQNLLMNDIYLSGLDSFSTKVLENTVFAPLIRRLFPETTTQDFAVQHRNRIDYQFDRLANISKEETSPKFVFAHILIPHPPFVYGSSCEDIAPKETGIENYLAQTECANRKIKDLVEGILTNSAEPPVIVLQADEGPYARKYPMPPGEFNFKEAFDNTLKERFGILNALYVPDIDRDVFYPSLSQVNTFRLIFNTYFGSDLDLLPDRSYIYADEQHFYKFSDVTDRLK